MPVEDHAVHDRVRHERPTAGCYDRPSMRSWYVGPGGVRVPHIMSVLCRQINNLPECEGCRTPKDHEYIEKMKHLL